MTPAGATSSTPRPAWATACANARSSASAAKVPGTGSPSIARWAKVREVEIPNAPACSASIPSRRISAMSSSLAASFFAPRSPIT